MSNGYIRLYRSLFETFVWKDKPFSYGQAWADMLLLANHKQNKLTIKGEKITVNRGQMAWSILSLADRWGWSRCKVRHFLGLLKEDTMIDHVNRHVTTLISICNYEHYQGAKDTKKDSKSNNEKTQTINVKEVISKDIAQNQPNTVQQGKCPYISTLIGRYREVKYPELPSRDIPAWNKVNFSTWSKYAKDLYNLVGKDVGKALDVISRAPAYFVKVNMSTWKFPAIVKNYIEISGFVDTGSMARGRME
jgi:hypothetical protein